jgi:hypothetical protein
MTNIFESAINSVEKKAEQVGGALVQEAHKAHQALNAVAAPIESAAHSAQMQVAGLLPHLSLSGGHDGHSPPHASDSKLHTSNSSAHPQDSQHGHLLHNLLDIGGTIAQGIGEEVTKDYNGVSVKVHGAVEATEKAAVNTATWVGHHPVESALIAAGAVLTVAAVVATAGLAAPVIAEGAAAVAAVAESAGITGALATAIPATAEFLAAPVIQESIIAATALIPIAGTYHAVHETIKNGELNVLMNQQNESQQAIDKAHAQLKHDTSHAAVNDGIFVASLGAGYLGTKAFQTFGGAMLSGRTIQESGEVAGAATPLATEAALQIAEAAPVAAEATPVVAEAVPTPVAAAVESTSTATTEAAPAARPTRNLMDRIAAIAEGVTGDLIQAANNCGTAVTTAGKLIQAVPGYPVAAADTHTVNPADDEPSKYRAPAAGAAHDRDPIYVPDEATHFTMPDAHLTY